MVYKLLQRTGEVHRHGRSRESSQIDRSRALEDDCSPLQQDKEDVNAQRRAREIHLREV